MLEPGALPRLRSARLAPLGRAVPPDASTTWSVGRVALYPRSLLGPTRGIPFPAPSPPSSVRQGGHSGETEKSGWSLGRLGEAGGGGSCVDSIATIVSATTWALPAARTPRQLLPDAACFKQGRASRDRVPLAPGLVSLPSLPAECPVCTRPASLPSLPLRLGAEQVPRLLDPKPGLCTRDSGARGGGRTYDLSQGEPQHLEKNNQAAGRERGGHRERWVLEQGCRVHAPTVEAALGAAGRSSRIRGGAGRGPAGLSPESTSVKEVSGSAQPGAGLLRPPWVCLLGLTRSPS